MNVRFLINVGENLQSSFLPPSNIGPVLVSLSSRESSKEQCKGGNENTFSRVLSFIAVEDISYPEEEGKDSVLSKLRKSEGHSN